MHDDHNRFHSVCLDDYEFGARSIIESALCAKGMQYAIEHWDPSQSGSTARVSELFCNALRREIISTA
jgi:hypothetical protein